MISTERAALVVSDASCRCSTRSTEHDLGVPPGFAAFARREHPRLVGALTLYCGDVALAEELAQDTWVRCRQRWEQVSVADRPGAYVHRTAINLANSWFRRRRAERRALRRSAGGVAGAYEDPCSATGLAVRRAVSSLPARQREVVVRRFFLDEDVVVVAAAMGLAPGSVRSATSRALATLREDFDVVLRDREEVPRAS